MLKQLILIGTGGAFGAMGRFLLTHGITSLLGKGFPYGTLVVNVSGSLLMGLLYTLLVERMDFSDDLRALLLVGFLGALTTFSTFSIDTLLLIEQGLWIKALLNVLLSVTLCLTACWLGLLAGRAL